MIRLVIRNLLRNALKFAGERPAPRIGVNGWIGSGDVSYCVRDNGVGFDAAYNHRLFRPFQRLHSQPGFEGAGLGLALVERVISRHGGRVWAEGKEGAGAMFYFTLPHGSLSK
jgi:signal transduction histidine kinase